VSGDRSRPLTSNLPGLVGRHNRCAALFQSFGDVSTSNPACQEDRWMTDGGSVQDAAVVRGPRKMGCEESNLRLVTAEVDR
jgi:hypothetical protein